jgi:hypothetical protein
VAINPGTLYPGQTDTTSDPTGYPQGKAKNELVDGDGSGTPLEATWVSDIWGFFQAALSKAGITPSGAADKVGVSQYLQSLESLMARRDAEMAACNWTKRTPTGAFSGIFYSVVWGESDGQAVAVGENGTIQRSIDAVTWIAATAAGGYTQTFFGVCRNSGFCVAVGASGEIQTSANNGVTWLHRTPAGGYSSVFLDVCSSGSLYVAVGASGEIQTSPDGVTWTHRTPAASYSGTWNGVTWTGSQFVAVGSGGEIQTSPDGITWTHRAAAGSYTGAWSKVAASPSLIVAVGANGEIQTSPTGVTWTEQASPITTFYYDIVWTGVIFAAAADFGVVITSPNGNAWTKRVPDTNNSDDFRGIAWSERRLITVGAVGKIYTSLLSY